MKHIEQRHIDQFEHRGPEWEDMENSFHTDATEARSSLGGFEQPIASGRVEIGYALQALSKWFGSNSVAVAARVNLRFLVPVVAGDEITVHGVVAYRIERNREEVVSTEFWLENQGDQKIAVGTGSVRLP